MAEYQPMYDEKFNSQKPRNMLDWTREINIESIIRR